MSVHELGPFALHQEVGAAIDRVSEQVANHVAAAHYGGEVPAAFHEYVEETARAAITDALDMTRVLDLEEYGADQELEDRLAADRERAVGL